MMQLQKPQGCTFSPSTPLFLTFLFPPCAKHEAGAELVHWEWKEDDHVFGTVGELQS